MYEYVPTFVPWIHFLRKRSYATCIQLYMMSTEKTTPRRPITEENDILEVFDHEIHQKLAMDVIGCRSTRNDMKFSGMGMECP